LLRTKTLPESRRTSSSSDFERGSQAEDLDRCKEVGSSSRLQVSFVLFSKQRNCANEVLGRNAGTAEFLVDDQDRHVWFFHALLLGNHAESERYRPSLKLTVTSFSAGKAVKS